MILHGEVDVSRTMGGGSKSRRCTTVNLESDNKVERFDSTADQAPLQVDVTSGWTDCGQRGKDIHQMVHLTSSLEAAIKGKNLSVNQIGDRRESLRQPDTSQRLRIRPFTSVARTIVFKWVRDCVFSTLLFCPFTNSYGHRTMNTRLPVRSAPVKRGIARLVLQWVTMRESLVP